MRAIKINTVLLLAGLAAALAFPQMTDNRYFIGLAIIIAFYGINAMALDIVLGVTGQISLCQSVFYGMGAYVSGILSVSLGWNFWLCLVSAIVATGLLALLVGLTSLRFKGHYLAMVTLALVIIFIEIVREWYDLTGGPDGFSGIGRPALGNFVFSTERDYYYLVLTWVVILSYFGHYLVRGRTGRALAAVRQDEVLSCALGINPMRFKLKAFIVSGIYGGVAGSLYAHYASFIGSEDFDLHTSITFLCMIVVGGLRTGIWGGLVGAALLTLLPELLSFLVRSQMLPAAWGFLVKDYAYVMMFYGVIVLAVVLYLPRGIVGLLENTGNLLSRAANEAKIKSGIGARNNAAN